MSAKPRILLGLSGGVDSAVAALLLQQQGFDVHAVFLKLWSDTKNLKGECAWKTDRREAYRVAAHLGIPIRTLDCEAMYHKEVMEEFFRAYEHGETPNPDILCNRAIKFPILASAADEMGIHWIATGHHARVVHEEGKPSRLLTGVDVNKDQTYFLAGMRQEELSRTQFPIGIMTKEQVRATAKDAGLDVWDRRSTRGICFVGKVDIPSFLRQKISDHPGKIKTITGHTIGEHTGVHQFTIGQRHGFGGGGGEPYFVVRKDVATQTLVVSSREEDLLSSTATLRDVVWVGGQAPEHFEGLTAQVRYRTERVQVTFDGTTVTFAEPVRAITPGQFCAFYRGEECMGGGTIV